MKTVNLRSGDLSGGRCNAINDASLIREKIYLAFFQRVNLSMFEIYRVFLADFASPAGLYCADGSLGDLSPEE